MMCSDPNFPPNLDIRPSDIPNYEVDNNGDAFSVASQEEAIRQYGIAGRVWEASYIMCRYLEGSEDQEFDPPFIVDKYPQTPLCVVELGSGTGIVGSQLAKMAVKGDDVIVITDLPEVCPLLEANLKTYLQDQPSPSSAQVVVQPLAWGNSAHALDITRWLGLAPSSAEDSSACRYISHVVCSDLVYFPELLAPLLRTLLQLTSPPFTSPAMVNIAVLDNCIPRVIISYKIRSLVKETPFWSAFGLWFDLVPVLTCPRTGSRDKKWVRFGSSMDEDMFVFVAHRRPESLVWLVPEGDKELLDGVGARGTNDRKGDDTFEALLLMALGSEDGLDDGA